MELLRLFEKVYLPIQLFIAYLVWQEVGFWTSFISLMIVFPLSSVIGWGIVYLSVSRMNEDSFESPFELGYFLAHLKNILLTSAYYLYFFPFPTFN